jgi:hypothetical protein
METTLPNVASISTPKLIHTIAGLGLGGFFGGPLAISYLIYRDLVTLGLESNLRVAAAWFGPLILFWIFCIFKFPPDFISQFILYLPQSILWWIVARHLLLGVHTKYRNNGGMFRTQLSAVRFGIFTFLTLKIVFFVGSVVNDQILK